MSGIGWGLGGSASSGIAPAPTTPAGQLDKILGRDIWLSVAPNSGSADVSITHAGDFQIVEGREALRQSIIRRLITAPGEYTILPDYGVGVRNWINERATEDSIARLKARIKSQLLKDTRIIRVDTIDIRNTQKGLYVITVKVTPRALKTDQVTATIEI